MKNIQVIDGADNATFSIFQATEAEFELIFPDCRDMELAEDLVARLGEEAAGNALSGVWQRPVLKRDAMGVHGTLFYEWGNRREHLPKSKREVDWNELYISAAQRQLFAQHR